MRGLVCWCLVLSLADFLLMGADKLRAKRDRRRVPEKWFFLLALLGGSPGAIGGMYFFRHKTRHWYFKWGLPAILILQAGALWLMMDRSI